MLRLQALLYHMAESAFNEPTLARKPEWMSMYHDLIHSHYSSTKYETNIARVADIGYESNVEMILDWCFENVKADWTWYYVSDHAEIPEDNTLEFSFETSEDRMLFKMIWS